MALRGRLQNGHGAFRPHFSTPPYIWAGLAVFSLFGCRGPGQPSAPAEEAKPATSQPAAEAAPGYTAQQLPGSTVEGTVLLQGSAPPPKQFQVAQDADVCGKVRTVYPARVEHGGVDDAVVWIDDIEHGKPFGFPAAQLQQQHCTYVPHILIMQADDLKITSQDSIPHNVHTYAKQNREYNESMNPLHREVSLTFPRPDVISVRCDLHGWMQAYVVVAKNPYYAISDHGGKFKLDGVPAGHYHLKLWSESLGESEQEIAVEAGKPTTANFTLKSPAVQGSGGN